MKNPNSDSGLLGCAIVDEDMPLVNRFKSGDEDAFVEIYDKYQERILNVANQKLHDYHEAEDVTQKIFVRVYHGLPNFRGDSKFSTWIYRIAFHLTLSHLSFWRVRKRERWVSFETPLNQNRNQDATDLTLADVIPERDPRESVLEVNDIEVRISKAMDYLLEKHRKVLILRNVEDLTYDEIAATLGINVGTVKSRLARAREHLRSLAFGRYIDLFD